MYMYYVQLLYSCNHCTESKAEHTHNSLFLFLAFFGNVHVELNEIYNGTAVGVNRLVHSYSLVYTHVHVLRGLLY